MEPETRSASAEIHAKTSPSEQLLVTVFRALRVLAGALTSHGVSPQMSAFAAGLLLFLLVLFLPLIAALFGLAIMLLSLAVCFSFAMVVSSICAFWWMLVFAIFCAVSFAIFSCSIIMVVTPFLVPIFLLFACGCFGVLHAVRMLADNGFAPFQRLDSVITTAVNRVKQESPAESRPQKVTEEKPPPQDPKPQPVDRISTAEASAYVDAVGIPEEKSEA